MSAPAPRPTAPGNGNEFRPWKAHPVTVNMAHDAMANAPRAAPRAVIVVALLAPVVAVPSVSTAGVAAASPRPVSAPAAPTQAVPRDPRAGRYRATPPAGPPAGRGSGHSRRVPGAVRCR